MIPVTRPFLPPLDEVQALLAEVWASGWVTNHGPKVQALEAALAERFDVGVAFVGNGTLALQLGIVALGWDARPSAERRPKVITTPFSYVATTSALVWQGCDPVFVDVDPATFNLDPAALAQVDLQDVTGILATHVYGVPCDDVAIGAFARKHGLTVMYDAAHAFDARIEGVSLFALGDVAATSFHATKLFHTIEGGAVFCRDADRLERIRALRNFGQQSKGEFALAGINAKNSEMHAAVGLAILPHMQAVLARRRDQALRYREALDEVVQFQALPAQLEPNHAYAPVLFSDEAQLEPHTRPARGHRGVSAALFPPVVVGASVGGCGEPDPSER